MHRLGVRTGPHARRVLAVAVGAVALLASISAASPAGVAAAKFTVTTTADAHDAHPGDGRCADTAGQCTLRAAIEEAGASRPGTAVTIELPAGYYRLRLGTLTVGAATSKSSSITIDGAGPGQTVISGGHAFRVMTVTASATAVLEAVQITDGHVGGNVYGGGVYSSGNLTIVDSAVENNVAGAGGGVDNAGGGSLIVTGSSVEHNTAEGWGGGGIKNGGPKNLLGSVLVVSSTIIGNVSQGNDGGGIFSGENGHPRLPGLAAVRPWRCGYGRCAGPLPPASGGKVLTVEDSNVSGNAGVGGGGIAVNEGTATMTGSVVDGNSGGAFGGGVAGVGSISDSTIAGNHADEGAALWDLTPTPDRMTITDSTIEANHAATYGGVLVVGSDDVITRSTIADNTAGSKKQPGAAAFAGIQGGGSLHLSNSTVAGNTTTPAGGGAIVNPATIGGVVYLSFDTLQNNVSGNIAGQNPIYATGTILATNGAEPDCQVPLFKSGGYNLATDRSCGLSRPTDLSGVNPMLGPLASNGGPTSTEALLTGSPAINAGGLPVTSGCPLTDQRGMSRPWGPACDIGAYESHYRLPG